MSARFFKIFTIVFLTHLVVFNIVWVGFSAPAPRPPVTFTYEGALPAQDVDSEGGDVWQKGKAPDQLTFDHRDASDANHWIEIRDPSKSFTYDHLGF